MYAWKHGCVQKIKFLRETYSIQKQGISIFLKCDISKNQYYVIVYIMYCRYNLYFTTESYLNSWPTYDSVFFWQAPRPLKNIKTIRKMHRGKKRTVFEAHYLTGASVPHSHLSNVSSVVFRVLFLTWNCNYVSVLYIFSMYLYSLQAKTKFPFYNISWSDYAHASHLFSTPSAAVVSLFGFLFSFFMLYFCFILKICFGGYPPLCDFAMLPFIFYV